MQDKLLNAMEGKGKFLRTAQWAVAQLKELHPVFYAQLLALHLPASINALNTIVVIETDADDEIQVATGQAMSI
jgi:hypothetical protein